MLKLQERFTPNHILCRQIPKPYRDLKRKKCNCPKQPPPDSSKRKKIVVVFIKKKNKKMLHQLTPPLKKKSLGCTQSLPSIKFAYNGITCADFLITPLVKM